MLASPLLIGVVAGGATWTHLPLSVFWFLGYFAFFATSVWLKSRRRARHLPPVKVYAVAAAVSGAVTAALDPSLLIWMPAFVVPLGVGLWAAAARHERDLLTGLTTVVGSGLMTLVAYDAGAGGAGQRAWQLALVQLLYFAGTVFYVKSAIRERDNRRFLLLSVGFHLLAALACALLAWQLGVLFAVLAVRAALVPPRQLSPKTLGIGEIVATVVVAVSSVLVLQP